LGYNHLFDNGWVKQKNERTKTMKNLIMLLGSLTMVGGTTLSLANITETKQNNVLTVTSKEFDKNQGGYGFEAITKYNNK
jgi:hypothetical protein